MRVLFVGPFPWPSHQGSQAYLAGQAAALARRGHDVHVVVYGSGTGGAPAGVTLHRSRAIPGGDFAEGGLHWSRPLHDLALARSVRRLAATLRPDLIHAHNVEGPLAARLARTGLPVVYDLHTSMAEELADHLPVRLAPMGPSVGRWVDRLALAASSAGCAISPRARDVLTGAGLPCELVGPGVDPGDLVARPGAAARFGGAPWVVYTGNLDRYQDLDLLYAAVRGSALRLRIVTGSGEAVPDGVDVVRSTDFRDAIDALAHAAVAVIPRRRCAGFPIKLLNQLGMGVPTVMMASAALPLSGVVPTGPAALRSTLEALVADPVRRASLGEAARTEVLASWTWDARMARLEALYDATLARR
ncbi:MAG: glycosyltransferase [Myxococcota bacterium]